MPEEETVGEQQEPDETVKRFAERHVSAAEGATTTLQELWEYYGPRSNGVPRERFKWHLIQVLPESADRDGNMFHGVEVVPFGE